MMTGQGTVSTYNLLVVITAALGSFTFGFTVNVTGPVLGMPSFYDYFGLDINETTSVIGGKFFAWALTLPPWTSHSLTVA